MGFLFKLRLYYQIQKYHVFHSEFYNPGIKVEAKHRSEILPMLKLKLNLQAFICMLTETQTCRRVKCLTWEKGDLLLEDRKYVNGLHILITVEPWNTKHEGRQTKSCNSQFSQWENRKTAGSVHHNQNLISSSFTHITMWRRMRMSFNFSVNYPFNTVDKHLAALTNIITI